MRPTLAETEFIETMAQQQFRYQKIFSAQADWLRTDPSKFTAAMAQIEQSPMIAKPGQPWEPTPEKVDEFLAHCDDICQLAPQTFEELSFWSSSFTN